jgi:hypothetical protein
LVRGDLREKPRRRLNSTLGLSHINNQPLGKIMNLINIALGLLLLFGSAQTLAETDDPRPINRMAHVTADRLAAHDFAELERQANALRKQPRNLSDGQPQLSGFYSGVSKCVQMRCGDEDLSPEAWAHHLALLDEWESKFPKSITAKLAKATYMKEFAWYARGLGYSNTVSKPQWQEFEQRILKARAMFDAIKQEGRTDPAWYTGMLSIALVQSWPPEEFNSLYAEGVQKFSYYLPLYFLKAARVSPSWGGSQVAFSKFADEVARTTSKDMGETMYARLNWSSWSPDMFASGRTDWNRMRNGFERMILNYPDPWNSNNFAKFACLAVDIPTLRKQLIKIGESPILDAWGSMGFYAECKKLAS